MSDSSAYTQGEVDSLVAIIGRHAERSRSIVHALEHVVKDRSITAAGRELVRIALDDARAIAAGEEVLPGGRRECPGCHPSGGELYRSGREIRQKPNGDLACRLCGRVTSEAADVTP